MEHKKRFLLLWMSICVVLLLGSLMVPGGAQTESVQTVMRDAVLHESDQISLLGLRPVNPGFISALAVTVMLLAAALCIRVFVIPKFKYVPGKFQLLLEQAVGMFDGLAKSNSPWRHEFLGAYIFVAGVYIFFGTLFELFGFQAIAINGNSVTLSAPLSDVNAAIMLGVLSYLVMFSGAIAGNGFLGIGNALKEISLLLSMSFRIFGALLSGLLVTELIYYYTKLRFVIPVIVAVLFTLLHAVIQSYVLTMLTALFYGEMSEPKKRKSIAAVRGRAKLAKNT